jgi:hypothetical protein
MNIRVTVQDGRGRWMQLKVSIESASELHEALGVVIGKAKHWRDTALTEGRMLPPNETDRAIEVAA